MAMKQTLFDNCVVPGINLLYSCVLKQFAHERAMTRSRVALGRR